MTETIPNIELAWMAEADDLGACPDCSELVATVKGKAWESRPATDDESGEWTWVPHNCPTED